MTIGINDTGFSSLAKVLSEQGLKGLYMFIKIYHTTPHNGTIILENRLIELEFVDLSVILLDAMDIIAHQVYNIHTLPMERKHDT